MAVAVALLVLSGCAGRSEREALRTCSFEPVRVERIESADDSLRVAVLVAVRNPGPTEAILDSFQARVVARAPLAALRHGKAHRIGPGRSDTVRILVSAERSSLLVRATGLLLSPPDSLRVEGTAWIPGLLHDWKRPFRWSTPYSAVGQRIQRLLGGL